LDLLVVFAQDHDVAITKIGKKARAFLDASRRPLVVVIGDIADHLQLITPLLGQASCSETSIWGARVSTRRPTP
jgi:hypothetical protein